MYSARGRGEAPRRKPDGSGYRPPGFLAKHGKAGPVNLADESRDTVRAVKALIEVERKLHDLAFSLLACILFHCSKHLNFSMPI